MRNMWVVMKETYLRHVKSWSFFFMVISPFLFLALSVGIGFLQGSSMAKNSKIAVVTTVPSVEEGLKGTNGINFDYKDEASAQAAIKDEKIKGYLTIDQEDSVLKAVYHGETSLETGINLLSKINGLTQTFFLFLRQIGCRTIELVLQFV